MGVALPDELLDGAEEIDAEYDQIRKLEGKRGDDSHIELWIMLMTVSAGCGIALFVLGRRRRVFGK